MGVTISISGLSLLISNDSLRCNLNSLLSVVKIIIITTIYGSTLMKF